MIPADLFQKELLSWYRRHKRDLPWRRTRDPYKIWVSEVMLQQTTVATVIPYWRRWLEQFPGIQDVARAPEECVLKAWQGLGYYQRARNLRRAAGQICGFAGGRFPSDYETLRRLPGFGPYTTAAVLSIAFDKPYPLVDANVRRVVMRLLGMRQAFGPAVDKPILAFLRQVLPHQGAGDFNQALMELGALVCRLPSPLCAACPVARFCRAYAKGLQETIPALSAKKISKITVVAAVIRKDSRLFLQRRPPGGLLAGLWELPGGKIEREESPRQALARELHEELAVSLVCARYLFTVRHAYTRFRVTLQVWACRVRPAPRSDRTHRWVTSEMLKNMPVPSATQRILTRLRMS